MDPKVIYIDHITSRKLEDTKEQFALDVLMGLSSKPKYIPPKYFYDQIGSGIFTKITETAEYYPTACEREILESNSFDIASYLKKDFNTFNIIELGAGDGHKTKILLNEFIKTGTNLRYIPIDISESAVIGLQKSLQTDFPALSTMGIVSEYFDALRWLRDENKGKNIVLFLGSSIGNFNAAQAQVFLRTMWNALNHGDYLFLGCDLKKNIDKMLHAYNDAAGHTRAFNLNLLARMNRELGADFDLGRWDHFGTYNVKLGAMESFLLSTEAQTVNIKHLNKKFRFKPFEAIHVEFSFKYLPQEVEELVNSTGFKVIKCYYDKKRYFMNTLVQVEKAV